MSCNTSFRYDEACEALMKACPNTNVTVYRDNYALAGRRGGRDWAEAKIILPPSKPPEPDDGPGLTPFGRWLQRQFKSTKVRRYPYGAPYTSLFLEYRRRPIFGIHWWGDRITLQNYSRYWSCRKWWRPT